jgi:hypothetical protein
MGTGMTDIVCREWYLNDLGVGKDRLAGIMEMCSRILFRAGVPEYSSPKSKKTFSDHFKVGLLVIRKLMDLTYRDLCDLLRSTPGVLSAGGADRVPEHSTLCKFASRLPSEVLYAVIGETALMLCGTHTVAAVDATGFSESNASRHYIKRLKQLGTVDAAVRDYAKVTIAGDVTSKAVISCTVNCSNVADIRTFSPVLGRVADTGIPVAEVLADKGFDADHAHKDARDILGKDTEVWIPTRECEPKSQKSAGKHRPGGRYRKNMPDTIGESLYNFRAIVETINSMLKRKMGDTVYGRSIFSIQKEVLLMMIAHNLRLLWESRSGR